MATGLRPSTAHLQYQEQPQSQQYRPPSPRRWRRLSFAETLLTMTIMMLAVVSILNFRALSVSENTDCARSSSSSSSFVSPPGAKRLERTGSGGSNDHSITDGQDNQEIDGSQDGENPSGSRVVESGSLHTVPPDNRLVEGTSSGGPFVNIKRIQETLKNLYDSLPPYTIPDSDTGRPHNNYLQLSNLYRRKQFVKLQDVTLVSHGSVKKLAPLIDQVERWQGPVSFCHLSEQSYRNCRLLFVPTRQGNTVAVRTHIHPCGGGETRWPAALPSECGPEPSTTIHRIQLFLVDGCRLFCHQGGPTGG